MRTIENIISKGGPNEEDYLELKRAIKDLESLTKEEEADLVKLITPILSINTMQGFAYHKPYGYAGDFEIIDRIYTHWKSQEPKLRKWDNFFHSQEAPNAVRNRKKYFIKLINKNEKHSKLDSFRVLNIGSGPARDVKEYFDINNNSRATFDCIDLDQKAIDYASKLCLKYKNRVSFIKTNIFRFKPVKKYNLIWSAGLFDYFNDDRFVRLTRKLLTHVEKGGELVVGNFCTSNPTRSYMEKFMGWPLNHRSDKELCKLALKAGISSDFIKIGREELGVNLFLHITST